MTRTITGINVYSDMNKWIDFIVVPENLEDYEQAEEIISQAFDEWNDGDPMETISEYICGKLKENGIEHEVYFKEDGDGNENWKNN